MLRLDPDPRENMPPDAGYPGVVQGEPLPLYVEHLVSVNMFYPPGVRYPFTLNLRRLFGPDFGAGIDVLEVSSRVLRVNPKTQQWEVAEGWEICMDDIKFEVVERKHSKSTWGGPQSIGIRMDGSVVEKDEFEWEALSALTGFA